MKKLIKIISVLLCLVMLCSCAIQLQNLPSADDNSKPLAQNPPVYIVESSDSVKEDDNPWVIFRSFDAIFEAEQKYFKLTGKETDFQEARDILNEGEMPLSFDFDTPEDFTAFFEELLKLPYPVNDEYNMSYIDYSTKSGSFTVFYENENKNESFVFRLFTGEKKEEFYDRYVKNAKKLESGIKDISAIYYSDIADVDKDESVYLFAVDDRLVCYTAAISKEKKAIDILEEFEFVPFKEVLDSKREA